MIQGHHAIGVFQVGSIAFVFGNNGEKENTGPNWELVLFRPYSKQWFYFSAQRGLTKRALDGLTRLARFIGLAQSARQ